MKIINELTQDIILDSHKQTYIRICKLFSDKYDLYRIFQNEYYIEQENDIEYHIMKTLRQYSEELIINKDDLLIVYSFIEHFKKENINSIKFIKINNIQEQNQELGYYFKYISK